MIQKQNTTGENQMYIVEGNIGVGKSTFLNLVHKHLPHITTVQEPKESWINNGHGKSLLSKFYDDPARWSYTIETLVATCRARDHLTHQNAINKTILLERSIYSGHYCFALNGYNLGNFSDLEWSLYLQVVNFFLTEQCRPPKGFIYLRAHPEITSQRIKLRNRRDESNLSFTYQKQINDLHDAFLIEKKNVFEALKHIPVLVLDCDEDFAHNPTRLAHHLEKLHAFIEENNTVNIPHVTPLKKNIQEM
jgi:deoxyadenosine/deoxycytidine kinase